MAPTESPDLARSVAAGNAAALETLYAACGGAVLRLAERFFPGEGEELRHELFLKIRDDVAAGRFDGRSLLTTWVWRVASNWCVDERRRRRRRERSTVPLEGLGADPPAPGSPVETAELADDVRFLFEKGCPGLREIERRVLSLRFAEGLSYREIAELLGAPIGTVSTWFNTGIAKLRAAMAEGRPPRPPIRGGSPGVEGSRRNES